MKPALILLGAVWSKNPAMLAEVRSRGLATLVIDEDGERAQRELAVAAGQPRHPLRLIDEHRLLPRIGVAEVLDVVRAWAERYDVRGLHSLREEFVEAGGVAADCLALPSPGLRASRVCRDKRLQRAYLGAWSPESVAIGSEERAQVVRADLPYPVVVKPVDRFASIGVQIARSATDLARCLDEYPADEPVLVEELVRGRETSVEALVQHGRVLFSSITLKETTQGRSDRCVEMAHTVGPSVLAPDVQDALLRANADVLRRLAFDSGIAHAEWMVLADGGVQLIEIAARNPGDSILPLYHLATGRPVDAPLVDLAIGRRTGYGPVRRYARQRYLDHPEGVLAGVRVDAELELEPVWLRATSVRPPVSAGGASDRPTVREILVEKAPGQELTALRSSMDRSVSLLFDAASIGELDALDRWLAGRVSVEAA